jgi:hypothetical protein
VAFSPDGEILASSAADGTVRVWSARSGNLLKTSTIGPRGGIIEDVAFTIDGRHLMTGNRNGTVYVLRLGPPQGPERQVAQWVLKQGGAVQLDSSAEAAEISDAEDLPSWEPSVIGVNLRNKAAVTDEDLEQLLALSSLQRLDVSRTKITPAAANTLARMPALRELELAGTKIGDEAIMRLQELKGVESLNLTGTSLSDRGIARLCTLPKLKALYLGHTAVTDAALQMLAEAKTPLEYLGVPKTQVSEAALAHLKDLSNLRHLHLNHKVTDRGLVHLQQLQDLTTLAFTEAPITDAGLEHLAKIATLRQVSLAGSKVTSEGLQRLRAALPNCRVIASPE